jgi:transcriptional regulator with PAS, ATPase and Fis domain
MKLKTEDWRLKTGEATLDEFFSSDHVMQMCLNRARIAARTDLPILLLGESGVGKTILARGIHNSSERRSGPFVSFNAAALSETLLDSQLFGHERGAFTGAQSRVKGKFELANNGTLFLDEVGDLTASAQSKILRAVETGEYERLGSDTLGHADVRVISATHYRIDPAAHKGRFRDDLFFRISGITITVPPLRDRPKDLPLLLASEVARAAKANGKTIVGLDRAAADRLLAYRWPGNLRELSTVIQAAVALTTGDVVGEDVLLLVEDAAVPADASASLPPPGADGRVQATADRRLREAVSRHIWRVLEDVGGNKRRAARELGVSRATLDRKLREAARGRGITGRS